MPRIQGTKVGLHPDGREIWSPIVVVSVMVAGEGRFSGPAVIDSGADSTVVPAEPLAVLGIDYANLPAGQSGQGAGGTFERRPLAASIKFRDWLVCDRIEVAEPGALPVILLGRHDFFRLFVVRFAWHKDPPYVDVDPIASNRRAIAT